jgi:hypothetical protein
MRGALAKVIAFTVLAAAAGPAWADIKLIGTGSIPGTATDGSGLTNVLEDGVTPNNRIGGLGSALAYTGVADFYLATPDRGPADGTTTYTDRAYVVRVQLRRNPAVPGAYLVQPVVVGTVLLRNEEGERLTGNAGAFDSTNSPGSLRFDPEGVRAAACGGRFYVSDEYGPFVYEFGPTGRRIRSLRLPNKFLIDLPSADGTVELAGNVSGRQSNRGMEGLAISPDGGKLFGIMQSPLLQDGALDSTNSRVGTNNRIVEIDVETGAVRELLYVMDSRSNGVSEILAVNDHELLVLERDGRVGAAAQTKKVFKIDLTGATDIRSLSHLPQTGVPAGVFPVAKALFLDLLDPAYGIGGASTPEKFEGLAFGPDLADGRRLLLVTVDNDFAAARPSLFYAFSIAPGDLPDFDAQSIRLRCPRGHGAGHDGGDDDDHDGDHGHGH